MAAEGEPLRPGLRVPHLDRLVETRGGEVFPIAAERDRPDGIPVAAQAPCLAAILHVPKFDDALPVPGGEQLAIRTVGDPGHEPVARPGKGPLRHALFRIEEQDRSLHRRGGKMLAIRTEGHAPVEDAALVEREREGFGALLPFPELDAPIRSSRGQHGAIRMEGHTVDLALVAFQGDTAILRLEVPDLDDPIRSGGGQVLAVGSKRHAPDVGRHDGADPGG